MAKRTITATESSISLPAPNGCYYDFTKTPEETPHAVRISVPPKSTFKGHRANWNEHYKILFTCISGRVHTFWGTGPYSNVDRFFGAGISETYEAFTLHSWQRSDQWQTASTKYRFPGRKTPENQDLFDRDVEKGHDGRGKQSGPEAEDTLTIAISPSPNYWDTRYIKRHELLYRNWASMELDAPLYPSLPTTPLPIRFLFALPSFLFPARLRNYLISFFLSIQILVLFSAFDHHPNLGSFPLMTLYAIWKFPRYWGPFPPQLPQWVSRCQWASMLFVSHWRIWLWSGIGKRLLGMNAVYEEYTPERLKDALDTMPGE